MWEAARGSNGGLSTVLERLCARCVGDQDWEASAETPLRDLGLDSIRAVSLKDSLQEQYGSSPSLFELQETASLASLQRMRHSLNKTGLVCGWSMPTRRP